VRAIGVGAEAPAPIGTRYARSARSASNSIGRSRLPCSARGGAQAPIARWAVRTAPRF